MLPVFPDAVCGSSSPGIEQAIVKRVSAGDLVITSDLLLATEVIEKDGHVLSHRSEWYSAANIRPQLKMRDFMNSLRASGFQIGGQPPMSQNESRRFAGRLDRFRASRS